MEAHPKLPSLTPHETSVGTCHGGVCWQQKPIKMFEDVTGSQSERISDSGTSGACWGTRWHSTCRLRSRAGRNAKDTFSSSSLRASATCTLEALVWCLDQGKFCKGKILREAPIPFVCIRSHEAPPQTHALGQVPEDLQDRQIKKNLLPRTGTTCWFIHGILCLLPC